MRVHACAVRVQACVRVRVRVSVRVRVRERVRVCMCLCVYTCACKCASTSRVSIYVEAHDECVYHICVLHTFYIRLIKTHAFDKAFDHMRLIQSHEGVYGGYE